MGLLYLFTTPILTPKCSTDIIQQDYVLVPRNSRQTLVVVFKFGLTAENRIKRYKCGMMVKTQMQELEDAW